MPKELLKDMTAETREMLVQMITNNEFTLWDILDIYIEEDRIIGVGLITVADEVRDYLMAKIKK